MKNIIKNVRNLFRFKKENDAFKERIIGGVKNLSEQEKKIYYKLVRVGNLYSNKYTAYESDIEE